ncbi:MAG: LysR family transcriptional regulator [Acidimicrobiales bacterium]|jgi:DNA-binding transcriptional LysR family regulator
MAASEWLRTFVAIYRAGSVTAGAADRGLSQPAASQQLAGLERTTGSPLFVRTAGGVEPTMSGRALYGQVVGPLDLLEHVLSGLDSGSVPAPPPTIRFGSTAEYFSYEVVTRIEAGWPAVVATFGGDEELLELLGHGELDVAVTSTTPARRSLTSTPIGMKRFVLVAAPGLAPRAPLASVDALAAWVPGLPWVAYSSELPLTRRFWQGALGRPFAGDLRLVAPDLRAVVGAVERAQGLSLLPTFVCSDALSGGTVVEVFPVSDMVPSEPWFVCTRIADLGRPHVAAFIDTLGAERG